MAAAVGSDCSLFLQHGPVVMRGKGEHIDPLPEQARARLSGRRVLVFKPHFGIATPWAYAQLAASAPASYLAAPEAEARLQRWIDDSSQPAEELLLNTMEPPALRKFVALPVMLSELETRFGLRPRMSGSGSACFALLPENLEVAPIVATIRAGWGDSAFVIEARLT